jgi:hypothetical protein
MGSSCSFCRALTADANRAYDGGQTVSERRGAELAPGTAVSGPKVIAKLDKVQ